MPDDRTTGSATPATPARVLEAARLLRGVAHRTPVVQSRAVSEAAGAELHLKAENLQRTGAFKFRGAYHALARLTPGERARGVITYSSGNHAQALALAGRLWRTRVTVVMPEDAPAVKAAATEGYGARIVRYSRGGTSREVVAEELRAAEELTLIPPYDHPDIIAGQGTAALELLEEAPPLEVLYAPCGGGGLLSGTALAARALAPGCRVVGVEPAAADDAARSFRSGAIEQVHEPETVADGLRTPSLGRHTFPIIRASVHDVITVSEEEILAAMALLWSRTKLVVEPSGAVALAGALSGRGPAGRRVGVIVSGGNVDFAAAAAYLAAAANAATAESAPLAGRAE
jgi:threo-3-hydroxy-L-aspartate ammonia-lyase